MSKVALFIFLSLGALLFSCSTSPDFPDEPVISFISINKTTFDQAYPEGEGDTIFIQIAFTDGDGDLGENNNAKDIEIIDARSGGIFETPSIPMLPEQGSGNGVEGEILIRSLLMSRSTLCCVPPTGRSCQPSTDFPQDTTQFLIRIRDRAGNWSNQVNTQDIFINCN